MDFSAVGERDRQAQAGGGPGCGTGAAQPQPARASCMREACVLTARSGHLTPMPSADPQSVRGSGVPSDAWAAVAKPLRGSGGIEFGGDLLSIVEEAGPSAGLGMAQGGKFCEGRGGSAHLSACERGRA